MNLPVLREFVSTTHTIRTIGGKEYTIATEKFTQFMALLETSKFVQIGDAALAVHQITEVFPTEETDRERSSRLSEYNMAMLQMQTPEEEAYALHPHERAAFAERIKDKVPQEQYLKIRDTAFHFTNRMKR